MGVDIDQQKRITLFNNPKVCKGIKAIIAGASTGALESIITYPTEYVKTQLQLDKKGSEKKYTGIFDCVKKTLKTHGIFGLYRGMTIIVIGTPPKTAIRFGIFEISKEQLAGPNNELTPYRRLVCGLIAGCSEAFIVVAPMESVKVKLVNDLRLPEPKYNKGFLKAIAGIINDHGIGSFYKGSLATAIKQSSNQAIRFFVVETLKSNFIRTHPDKPIPSYLVGLMGFSAGGISVLLNNPVDVIKTRMQGLESKKYRGTMDCLIQIFRQEGPKAFYKGMVPRLCRVCLSVGISFMLFDKLLKTINRLWPC